MFQFDDVIMCRNAHCEMTPSLYIALANIDGLMRDCSNSFVNALELLQSCTNPSISSVIFGVGFVDLVYLFLNGMSLPLDFLLEYQIERITMDFLWIKFIL